jgi:hypothetical protein
MDLPEWAQTVEVNFNFPYINFSKNIKGLSAIYEFVLNQIAGWEKYQNNLPPQFMNSKDYFVNIRNRLIQFLNTHRTEGEPQLSQYFNTEVRNYISATHNLPFLYSCPETEFLMRVFTDYPNAFQGAYTYIVENGSLSTNDKNSLIGALLAYEFTMKDHTELTERRNAEKLSMSKIRGDFHRYLNESEEQLVAHLHDASQNYALHVQKMDEMTSDKEKLFGDWFKQTQDKFEVFHDVVAKKVTELETTYEELLRLKKPAEYWSLRAAELKKEGWRSLNWLIGLVAFACFTLYSLLWLTPEGMLKTFFNEDKSLAVRWSIIFVTFISFLYFGIRALMKVTFSSFHLARDAEERERLTYVYLAMVKDTSVEKEDRHLIMQSLFSRADTGLLKDDSSPTMPGAGGVLDKVLSK